MDTAKCWRGDNEVPVNPPGSPARMRSSRPGCALQGAASAAIRPACPCRRSSATCEMGDRGHRVVRDDHPVLPPGASAASGQASPPAPV